MFLAHAFLGHLFVFMQIDKLLFHCNIFRQNRCQQMHLTKILTLFLFWSQANKIFSKVHSIAIILLQRIHRLKRHICIYKIIARIKIFYFYIWIFFGTLYFGYYSYLCKVIILLVQTVDSFHREKL